jgi:hypothetical protein
VELRVPGIPPDIRDRTASVCVTLAQLVIAAAADEDADHAVLTQEYTDVLLAYLEAKFPSIDHPAWTDPDAAVKPLYPAPQRAERLAGS